MTAGLISGMFNISQLRILQVAQDAVAFAGGVVSFSQTSPSGTMSVAALAVSVNAGAVTLSSGAGLKLVFSYDTSWSSAPTSYNTALASAASIIEAACPNTNITVNIECGYGFFDQVDLGTGDPVPASSSVGSAVNGPTTPYATYSQIRAALAAIPNPSASLTALLTNTPSGTSLNGTSNFYTSRSVAKALGLFSLPGGPTSATDTGRDGAIGMGSGWSTGNLVGVFLHEIWHAMGRAPSNAPFCFSRFTSAGNRDFGNSTNGTYFALDGGTAHLGDYGTVATDCSDWLNGGAQDGNTGGSWQSSASDCFDAYQGSLTTQNLSSIDIQLINSMGFQ